MTELTRKQPGFTLVEMAVALAIVGLLLSGLIPTLSSQMEQRQANETRKQLDEIQQALIGFAIANGRLPCPASDSPTSYGQESFCTSTTGACIATTTYQSHGKCSNFYNGLVPAATLGISPVDAQGYLLDGWGNRIRYAVIEKTINGIDNALTSNNGMQSATMTKITDASLLNVCVSSTGITGSDCGAPLNKLTDKVPALIYSTGKNGGYGGTGADEAANLNGNRVFVSHTPTPGTATNGEFDDLIIWLSPNILFNRMVAAGRLP